MRKIPDSCSMLSRVCINRSASCCLSSPKSSIFSSHFLARCNKYASKSAKIDGRSCDITCTPINCRVISIGVIARLKNIIQVWAPTPICHTHRRRERDTWCMRIWKKPWSKHQKKHAYNDWSGIVWKWVYIEINESGLEPVFHGACFEADSVPILYAPYMRRVRPCLARIRRGQNRRRIRFKTRSMENGLNTTAGPAQFACSKELNLYPKAFKRTTFHTPDGMLQLELVYNRTTPHGRPSFCNLRV